MNPTRTQAVAVLLLCGMFFCLAVMSADMYDAVLTAARAVILVYSAQKAVELLYGTMTDAEDFLAGVGGLLYTCGIVGELAGAPHVNGRDLDFLVRAVGGAFLVLPLVLSSLPRPVRRSLGLEAC
ncbi:hypothetical protein V3W47_19050 [Deinococcus sp. YIM 134068]|uniref:hypothetical protein n=1 Tax=Deinococcus lichenicola TaxID=3118910 RepID=UPI002F9472CD